MNLQEALIKELQFKAVRSSGPGGQHVNKTSSAVQVSLDVVNSEVLSESQKSRISEKLKNRISTDGVLTLSCSESRSQHRNKAIGIERIVTLVIKSLRVSKTRKKTKPSRSSIEKRITSKKNNALKKANRKPPKID
ncbi:alternative ribosome rescue aminoacyl-tRNA hydrolase ArfB [Patiriisocius marinus]|uniref:Aminoacyl-tRNA hydrolase n=1 Tax=Patiriisocius marinus TaxID=1397112 RepID=A0A5J4J0I5_9FLAO|nr:alternative ribosome rescue aminoacyl-tRNA hydrolase ArfB [Patiriisocius marinus]GER60342.1 aminoacyl-tRNA hydrolase [Patiriisocius marinus]